jgi:hypothetical protein
VLLRKFLGVDGQQRQDNSETEQVNEHSEKNYQQTAAVRGVFR